MDDIDAETAKLEQLTLGYVVSPRLGVVIAAYRAGGRNAAQCLQQLGAANVAGMDNMIRAGEKFSRLSAEEAVGVGNHADAES